MINEYYSQAANVEVRLVSFSTTAANLNGGNAYASKDAAIAAVTALALAGSTNYEDALIKGQTAMNNSFVSLPGSNVDRSIYFLSDGDPTAGNTTNPVGVSGYSAYLTLHPEIHSYGVGVGSGITNVTHLNGIHNVDSLGDGVRDTALIVADVAKLEDELLSTVPSAYGGNVIAASGTQRVSFGGDEGHISQMDLLLDTDLTGPASSDVSVTFSYNEVTNQISWTGTVPGLTSPVTNSQLTLSTANGFRYGTLTFNFATGDYTYFSGGLANEGDSFHMNFTAVDRDGDSANGSQTVNIVDGKPIANDDTDTLSALQTSLEGNALTGVGTDGGIELGSQITSFTPQASGVDSVVDNAQVSGIVFKGTTLNLTVNSSGSLGGGSYSVTDGVLTWTHASNGSSLIFQENGYYKYVPPTANVPVENPAAFSTISLVSTAPAASEMTLLGWTNTRAVAATSITTAFTSAPANITLSAVGSDGGIFAEGGLAYNGTTGVGVNSATLDVDNARFDTNEILRVSYDAASYPQGVNNPSFALNIGTAGPVIYTVYDTSGVVMGGPTTTTSFATGNRTLSLAGYTNVGRVDIQAATTVRLTVTSSTYTNASDTGVRYDATNGAAVATAGAGGISNLETLVMTFGSAHPKGVQKLQFEVTNGNATDAVTYTFFHIDGHEIGQYTVAGNGWIVMPTAFSGVGRVTALADSGTTINIRNVRYEDVIDQTGTQANAVAPEIIEYTLTDSDGDASQATLTLNITSNTWAGGSGNDTYTGTTANDAISGGAGNDSLSGVAGHDVIQGGDGNDTIAGGDDNDIVSGDAGDDSLTGDAGNDILRGGEGLDTLSGGTGTDQLEGGSGNDSLSGGDGADTLSGGAGNDFLTGGLLSDVFEWTLSDAGTRGAPAVDTITDFDPAAAVSGGDVLDLRDLLNAENHVTGTGNLVNYLHFEPVGLADTKVHISTTGGFSNGYLAAAEDQTITLQGVNLYAYVGTGASDQQIIQDLLNKGKLITD